MLSNYQTELQKKVADCLEYEWPQGTVFRIGIWKGETLVKTEFDTIAEAYDFAEMNGQVPSATLIKKPGSKRFTGLVQIKL